jgi:hypothetical protein
MAKWQSTLIMVSSDMGNNFKELTSSGQSVGNALKGIVAGGGIVLGFQLISQAIKQLFDEVQKANGAFDNTIKTSQRLMAELTQTKMDALSIAFKNGKIGAKEYEEQMTSLYQKLSDQKLSQATSKLRQEIEALNEKIADKEVYSQGLSLYSIYNNRVIESLALQRDAKQQELDIILSTEQTKQDVLGATSTAEIAMHQQVTDSMQTEFDKRVALQNNLDTQMRLMSNRLLKEDLTRNRNSLLADSTVNVAKFKNAKTTLEEKRKVEESAANASLGMTSELLGRVNGLQKRGTKEWKVVAKAQALIDTYLSAQKAYTRGMEIPGIGMALAPVFAAAAVAFGLMNIAKINSVSEDGGGGSPSISTPSISTPSLDAYNVGKESGTTTGSTRETKNTETASTQQVPANVYFNQSLIIHGNVMAEDFINRIRESVYDGIRMSGGKVITGGVA